MKKYSSKKCHRGKTAYRTPSEFRYKRYEIRKGTKIRKTRRRQVKNQPFGVL